MALVAACGILFVLITPAPDELPSTGPHSLDRALALFPAYLSPLPPEIFTHLPLQFAVFTVVTHDDLLSFTCARLC